MPGPRPLAPVARLAAWLVWYRARRDAVNWSPFRLAGRVLVAVEEWNYGEGPDLE